MRNTRAFVLAALALTITLFVAGCGSSGSQPEEGVLRVWTTWPDDPAQIQALFDRYGQDGGLPVRVTAGMDSDDISKAMAGPTPPDVVILSTSDLVQFYYKQGWVEPLEAWIDATGIDLDDIYPAPLAQCRAVDGTYLCLPWGCDTYALFWNKDLFAAAGLDPERPPQTMEELAAYADLLTVRDEAGELSQVGFIPDLARSHTELYVRMFGGYWTHEDGSELALNSQPMIDAANWQRQFYDRYGVQDVTEFVSSLDRYRNSSHPIYAGKRLSCQQCHRNTPPKKSPDRGFYAGKVAMMVGGGWQVGQRPVADARPELNYGVAPFPPPAGHPEWANTSLVQGAVALMPAGVNDKEAAAKLLAWMVSPEILAEGAYANASLPTSRTAARDPRFQQMPRFKVFMDLMAHPNAKHVVTLPMSPELNRALGQVEDELLHDGGDPVRLLNQVQADFSTRLSAR